LKRNRISESSEIRRKYNITTNPTDDWETLMKGSIRPVTPGVEIGNENDRASTLQLKLSYPLKKGV